MALPDDFVAFMLAEAAGPGPAAAAAAAGAQGGVGLGDLERVLRITCLY